MLKLYPSTIAFINLCLNIVVRAIALTIALGALALISLPFNILINYALRASGISEALVARYSFIALITPSAIGIAMMLATILDIWNLIKFNLYTSDYTHKRPRDER